MAILHVRGVPDELYEQLREQAAVEHRSLSSEVITLLEKALGQTQRIGAQTATMAAYVEDYERIIQRANERAARYGPFPDSVADISAERARRE
jgi:plasmid stability protein